MNFFNLDLFMSFRQKYFVIIKLSYFYINEFFVWFALKPHKGFLCNELFHGILLKIVETSFIRVVLNE